MCVLCVYVCVCVFMCLILFLLLLLLLNLIHLHRPEITSVVESNVYLSSSSSTILKVFFSKPGSLLSMIRSFTIFPQVQFQRVNRISWRCAQNRMTSCGFAVLSWVFPTLLNLHFSFQGVTLTAHVCPLTEIQRPSVSFHTIILMCTPLPRSPHASALF